MKVLVTGAAGFIGSWTVSELTRAGHQVIGTDVQSGPGIQQADITNLDQVVGLFEKTKPEAVVHLAAISGATGKNEIEQSMRQTYLNYNVNVLGTINVCEACKKVGVGRLVFMSSFSVYGRTGPDRLPITPETPVMLEHAYATSKYTGELIVKNYAEDFGIKSVVFRTPFIVGEHQKEMNVVREFIDSASRGGELLIFGEGKHVREFIHPTDLVSAFDLALRKMDGFERKFEILVLGNKSVAIRDVATIVAKRVGKGTVAYKKTAVDRAFNQYSDYSKAEKLLGWKPKLQLEAIVDRVVSSDFS